jgi:hypothetical protein
LVFIMSERNNLRLTMIVKQKFYMIYSVVVGF